MPNRLYTVVLRESRSISEDLAITERGRTLNSSNESLLRQAAQLLVKVIKSIKPTSDAQSTDDDEDVDDAPAEGKDKTTKEAGTFNQSDTFSLLQAALTQTNGGNGYDTYISDIYEDQGYFVYRKGYSGGYFKTDFAISPQGVVTLGSPETVVRKVTYIAPTIPATESRHTPAGSLIDATLQEDTVPVQLVEKTVASDGTVMLKLIAPGKGSSGYYTTEVLKRDGPRVFTRGMHNFIDHPTPQEEAERPEGSINRLGSTLVEDAHWLDAYRDASGVDAGPGLYARATVAPGFVESLDAIANNIGTSIRATGKARMGQIGDYKGPIIEQITSAKSVDYVTMPGAGGKVLSLVESARKQGVIEMGATEELAELRQMVSTLATGLTAIRESTIRAQAPAIVSGYLDQYPTLPPAIKAKLAATLPAQAPLTESRDAIDVTGVATLVETAVKNELAYVQQLGADLGFGAIVGFGSINPITESDPAQAAKAAEDELATLFASPAFGLSVAEAKIAAAGRE